MGWATQVKRSNTMDPMTRLRELAATTDAVRQTSSRKAKTELLADLLRRLDHEEIEPAVGFLVAKPRQGAIGVGLGGRWPGWMTWSRPVRPDGADDGAAESRYPPTVLGLDALLSEILTTTGSGSVGAPLGAVDPLPGRMRRRRRPNSSNGC